MTSSSEHTPAGNGNSWLAPAKLNLFLHITGRRDDGYHLLETVFQLLDYGDELKFRKAVDNEISLAVQPHNEALSGDDNLVLRAARALKAMAQNDCRSVGGVNITLNKRLPFGGGLGGGSSDAATTLVALNQHWQLGYSTKQLANIGLTLGADVPVFVYGHSAWAEGVGEKLQPLTLPKSWYVVIHPAVHVSTGGLFGHSQLTRDCTPITIRGFQSGLPTTNVFQSIVCSLHSAVGQSLDLMQEAATECNARYVVKPRMTGTGSCVFAGFENETEAQNVLGALTGREQKISCFIAAGIDHSSLSHYK